MNDVLYRAVDGMLSEAEEAELAKRLGEEPDLASEMLKIARDEALLAEAFARRRTTRRLPQKSGGFGWFLAAAAAVLLGIVGIILLPGGRELDYDRARVKELTAEGATAVDRNDFERGEALYRQALELAEKHDELRGQAASIRATLADVSRMKSEHAQALADWRALVAEFRRSEYSETKEGIQNFLSRARALQKAHEPLGLPWTKADPKEGPEKSIAGMIEIADAEYKEALASARREGFQAMRARIEMLFLKEGTEDFAGAIAAWQTYIDTTRDTEGKTKAPGALMDVNRRAFGAWDRLKKKAETLSRDEAVRVLKNALPRFVGCRFNETDIEAEIRAKIEELKR